jgi:hypothetical protein
MLFVIVMEWNGLEWRSEKGGGIESNRREEREEKSSQQQDILSHTHTERR